jgi:hypothetical protein
MSETKNYDPKTKAKYSELKSEWAKLRKESNSSDTDRVEAKKRINAIQTELSLEITDFNAPKGKSAKSASSSVGQASLMEVKGDRSNEARLAEVKSFHDTAGQLANDILAGYYANNSMTPDPKERLIAWEGLLKSFAIVWSR